MSRLPTALTIGAGEPAAAPGLSGRRLVLARVGWLAIALPCIALYFWSLPALYRHAAAFVGDTLPAPDVLRAGMLELGLPETLVALVRFLRLAVVATCALVVGIIIFWRRSDERAALIFSLLLVVIGAAFAAALPASTVSLDPWLQLAFNVAFASFFLSAYLFPDGRFVPRWTRWLLALALLTMVGDQFFAGTLLDPGAWPPALALAFSLLLLGSLIAAQVYRYRRISGPVQRQQTKWFVFSVTVVIVLFFAYWTTLNSYPTLATTGRAAILIDLIGGTVLSLSFALVPLCIGFAVMRHRLWDIDPIVNRTLVYTALTATLLGLYLAVVGYAGVVAGVPNHPAASMLAAALVAVLFQPLRARLQTAINRLMYGHRDEPYAVIAALGRRLESTLNHDALLPSIVTATREALKLPYAALTVRDDGQVVLVAEEGLVQAGLVRLPIHYQSEWVGELLLAPRAPGEIFSPADRRLLADLARQAGMAIHAVRLTRELQMLNQELQQARVQLVTTREEERRRLAHDLHDGFGSMLASLGLRAGAIRTRVEGDPQIAGALATEQQEIIRAAIADLRGLIQALRPPALDGQGLGAALEQLAIQHRSLPGGKGAGGAAGSLPITVDVVDAADEALPAAVEVAAYRIVQEALTNVMRHARASTCRVQLARQGETLRVVVEDDGLGPQAPSQEGIGTQSMRLRAEELGGACRIEPVATGGTRVVVLLPLGRQDDPHAHR